MRSLAASIRPIVTRAAIAAALAAATALVPQLIRAQSSGARAGQDPLATPQELADCLASGAARVSRHRRTGAVRYIGMDVGRTIVNPRPLDASRSPESAARAYLSVCGSLFGLGDQSSGLVVTRNLTAGANRRVVRFQQLNRGIPVIGGELNVHVDAAGNVRAVAGKTLPTVSFGANPAVGATTALQTAADAVARTYAVATSALSASAPELWVFAPALLGPDDGPPRIVWRTEVTSPGGGDIREFVLVDAVRGGVALQFSQIETSKNRLTYTLGNTTTLPGTLICNESNPTCAGGDADAVLAHQYAGDTYDFYQANFGRDSLNNLGMTLTSSVHYGPVGYQNAFWNGAQMAYGDSFSQADDVVGHELTHGVTQFTSNLFYYYQSGAINESLSDVFGEFIDQTNGRGNDSPAVRWLLGEDVPGGAIRTCESAGVRRSRQDDQPALFRGRRRQRWGAFQQRHQP
jgi:Zn-dependent metalloprotease